VITATPLASRPVSVKQQSGNRIVALDWVKGALVVLMVIYHSINYTGLMGVAFRLMAFLPTSFILITGLLLTSIYLAKFKATDWRLHRRLLVRGLKLIILFVLLNVSMILVRSSNVDDAGTALEDLASKWREIFFFPSKRIASSSMLIAIGYLLLLAPLVLALNSVKNWLLPMLTVLLFAAGCYWEWVGTLNYYFSMVTFGIIGMCLGRIPLGKLEEISRRWAIVLPLYCAYRLCSYLFTELFPVQLAGTVLSLLILLGLALILSEESFIYRQCALLGRYSLFGYIFQLLALQVLRRVIRTPEPIITFATLTVITLLLTWLGTVVVEKLRRRARAVDASYKFVFA
jgi:hypothetical protein